MKQTTQVATAEQRRAAALQLYGATRIVPVLEPLAKPMRHQPRGSARRWRAAMRLTPRLVATLTFIAVLLVNVLGYGAIWGFNAYTTQKAARADLNLRIAHLQTLASGGKAVSPAGLAQARVELTGIDSDLRQLRNLLPFNGISSIEPEATLAHTLNMGIDAVDAALGGVALAQTLSPAMLALIYSVSHSASQAPPAGVHPLTMEDVATAQRALAVTQANWTAAMAERRYISPGALQSLGDPRLGKLLTRFDSYAPMVSLGLATLSATVDWSPAALGVVAPFNVLLFNMDTDELRPTGGFLGNYAQLTLAHGQLVSGLHLHDVYTLDCPNYVCRARTIPAEYAWFPLSNKAFGVRDSNLNPDFPTFAGLVSKLYQQTSGSRVDMVIAVTPAIIEDVLRVTGPITVPQYNVKITPENLTASIHYYHQNPDVTTRLHIDYKSLGTSVFKAFDVLLSRALLARLTSLTGAEQGRLGTLLVKAFGTKDIQVYVNNTRLQTLLQQIGVTGQVLAPNYDNLMVVDTNDGASYSNSDMQETISDHVALDATGAATHTLTITYYYRANAHIYSQKDQYANFTRVIVGAAVTHMTVSGPCSPKATKQSSHYSFGCQLSVARGKRVTVTFSWRAPHALTTSGGQTVYRLLIQRQAGAQVSMNVSITAPSGGSLSAPDSAMRVDGGRLAWSESPLLKNTTLTAVVG